MSYVTTVALKEGVNPVLARYIVLNESGASTTELGDMELTCNYKKSPNYGKPIRAKGIWQFTDCYHPEVSDDEAFDVASSTALAMPLLKDEKTCRRQFTTCDWWYATDTPR